MPRAPRTSGRPPAADPARLLLHLDPVHRAGLDGREIAGRVRAIPERRGAAAHENHRWWTPTPTPENRTASHEHHAMERETAADRKTGAKRKSRTAKSWTSESWTSESRSDKARLVKGGANRKSGAHDSKPLATGKPGCRPEPARAAAVSTCTSVKTTASLRATASHAECKARRRAASHGGHHDEGQCEFLHGETSAESPCWTSGSGQEFQA